MTDEISFPLVPDLSVSEIQDVLRAAHEKLEGLLATNAKDEIAGAQILLASTTVGLMLALSNSGNQFPGLRGLGLEQVLLFSQKVLTKENLSSRDFDKLFHVIAKAVVL